MRGIAVFSGTSHPELAEAICKKLGIPLGVVNINKFSNLESNVRDLDVYIVQSGCGNVNDNLIELLIMISACRTASARSVTAVIPLFPYSREPDNHPSGDKVMSRVPPVDMDRLNQLYTKNLLPMYSEPSSASLLVENRSMSPSVSMGVFSLESSPDRTIEENSLRRVSTLSTSQPRQTVPLIHSYSHSVLKPNDNGSKYKNWTAKSGSLIADLLMTAGADHIITMDLHDPQFIGFFDIPVENLSSQPLMIKYIKDSIPEFRKAIIVSPDAGGAKRASIIADKLNMDFALVHKERRFNKSDTSSAALFGSDIQMMLVGDVKNRVCILIDDIADTSFTICRASKLLKESGAIKVYALITHAIMSGNAIERLKKSSIDEIIVSNTVPQTLNISKSNGMVKVFDVAPLFAEAIRRIHNGESVSFLLDVVAI